MMNKSIRLLAIAPALAAMVAAAPAEAAQIRVCAPIGVNGTSQGARAGVATGALYTRDARGCMLVSPLDLGGFLAVGYKADPPVLVGYQVTSNGSIGQLPIGAYIDSITIQETSGATVTGGVNIGTTSAGTDVDQSIATASTITTQPDTSIKKRAFSSTAPQSIFVSAGSLWNSAAVNVTIHYSFF